MSGTTDHTQPAETAHIPFRGWAFIVAPFAAVFLLGAAVVVEAVTR